MNIYAAVKTQNLLFKNDQEILIFKNASELVKQIDLLAEKIKNNNKQEIILKNEILIASPNENLIPKRYLK